MCFLTKFPKPKFEVQMCVCVGVLVLSALLFVFRASVASCQKCSRNCTQTNVTQQILMHLPLHAPLMDKVTKWNERGGGLMDVIHHTQIPTSRWSVRFPFVLLLLRFNSLMVLMTKSRVNVSFESSSNCNASTATCLLYRPGQFAYSSFSPLPNVLCSSLVAFANLISPRDMISALDTSLRFPELIRGPVLCKANEWRHSSITHFSLALCSLLQVTHLPLLSKVGRQGQSALAHGITRIWREEELN